MDPNISEAFLAARLKWSTGGLMVCQAAGPSTSNSQQPDYTPAPQIQQQQPKHHVVEVNDAESQTENAMIVIAERIATALEKVASALGGQLPPAPAHAAPPAPAHAATPAPAHAAPSAPAHAAPSAPAHAAPSAPSHAAPPAPAHAAQAAQPLSGAAQAGEESQDTYDPYVPIDDSEDDVDPSTRCGVCRAGLGEVQYALECGHYPYCNECVENLRGFLSSKYECPFCKATGKTPLLLQF